MNHHKIQLRVAKLSWWGTNFCLFGLAMVFQFKFETVFILKISCLSGPNKFWTKFKTPVIGAIFLRRFRLYILSFKFIFMFANICFEKNQNSKIHVMFIINITWNETWNNQVLPFASINMNHNIEFFPWFK